MSVDILNIVRKDQEPNPFEESFSAVSTKFKSYAPPIKQQHYGNILEFDENMYHHDSYSTLSDQHTTSEDSDDHSYLPPSNQLQYSFYEPNMMQPVNNYLGEYQPKPQRKYNKKSTTKSKRNRNAKIFEDEEKRKNFLERNRLAALKCRQRKKQWVANLQTRVDYLTTENEQLQLETEALRKEILELKTLLIAHKNCPQYMDALKDSSTEQPPVLYNRTIPIM